MYTPLLKAVAFCSIVFASCSKNEISEITPSSDNAPTAQHS